MTKSTLRDHDHVIKIGNKSFSFPPIESILNHLDIGFFILDENWSIIYVNPPMENWVGKTRAEFIGINIWDVFPDAVGSNFYYFYHKAMEEKVSLTFEEFYEGTQEWLKITVDPYNDGIIGYVTNITESKKSEETINQISLHDFLTGLPNRNMLQIHLSNELSIAAEKKHSVAVLFINIGRFKFINHSLGSILGDLLLKEVTMRLQAALEHKDILFRNVGDEFIAILANSDRNEAAKIANLISEHFHSPFYIENHEIFTSLSIGISLSSEDGETADTLIKHANLAMAQCKRAGTSTFEFYSPDHQEVSTTPFTIEMDLYKALEQNQFSLDYQPKIDLRTGSLIGVEALIRWNHPEWGNVPPETFIGIAEDTGLIIPIGEWVLMTACRQIKSWQQEGFSPVVSVNLSPKQFKSTNIVQTIADILQMTQLSPRYLDIELTESLASDIEQTISTLLQLKKLGVSISIDDFGTGVSSLSFLKKSPIDTLKIDKSFIRELPNPNDETIVKTIISMAHNLNLNVVAEGVETKEQLLFLQQHMCDHVQGYFFSKPLPPQQLIEKLSEVKQVVRRHGIPQDVNERMWAEELLNQAKKELHDTIRMQQGMTFKFKKINGQFIHTLCDGELLYKLGLVPAQVVGKRLDEFLPIENALRKTPYYERAWEGEELVAYEDRVNELDYLVSLRSIKKGGEITEVIGSGVDITERKQAEMQLAKKERLAVIGDLAAGVAHEIRNPITAIKGFIQLFQQGVKQPRYFDVVFDEFRRLEDILQEFLNLAKPQEMKLEWYDIPSILQEVEILFQSEANLNNVRIFQEYEPSLPKVICDRNQIKQVFINLIKNSIEAIETEGIITISGSVDQDHLLIKIKDNGIGISEERLKRLGEPFYSNKEKGTGLGMMLCFRIIKHHNGTIIVKSKENQGTTVEVRLPIPKN